MFGVFWVVLGSPSAAPELSWGRSWLLLSAPGSSWPLLLPNPKPHPEMTAKPKVKRIVALSSLEGSGNGVCTARFFKE